MRADQIALQLYTVRDLAAADLEGTLRAVADAGYRAVEIAGLPAMPPRDLRQLLEASDLRAIAVHQSIEHLRDDADAVIAGALELGVSRVLVPWLPESERLDTDGVRAFAADLGRYAQRASDSGLRLGYHNHAFEFAPLDGTTVWDVLLAELDPAVDIELDVFWASVGGRDPVAEIAATTGRVRLLHMKDRAPGATPRDEPVGEGTLPFAAIVEAGRAAGVEWYVVEQDDPRNPLDDITTSLRYLETLAD